METIKDKAKEFLYMYFGDGTYGIRDFIADIRDLVSDETEDETAKEIQDVLVKYDSKLSFSSADLVCAVDRIVNGEED